MAEEHSPLEGHSGKHPRSMRNCSDSFRHRGWHRGDGTKRAANGTPRPLGKIVLSDDPVAADATCAPLMGFEPSRIGHIHEGTRFPGNASSALIDQTGESVVDRARPFQVVPAFRHIYGSPPQI